MKILFVTDLYPIKWGENNTPKTLHNFVLEWIQDGHIIDVIKPNFILNSFLRKKPFYKTGFYEFDNVKIFNVNYHTPFLFDIEKKLPKEFDLNSYDVIVAHMPSGEIFANKLAKKYNKPLICGVHCSDIAILKNPIYKFYFRKNLIEAYKNARRIACRSHVLEKKLLENFPEFRDKTFLAPSGINESLINKQEFYFHNPIKVVTCANLIKRKNTDKLIFAIKDLEDFELKIIGEGPQLRHLKGIVNKYSLENRVEFTGKLDKTEVIIRLKNSHIFVLPSVSETFGMVYLEAMANGCITVCTKNDGIDGIIKDGENGFLTNPTPESIRETLLRIKNTPDLNKIVENAYETIDNYTQEICAKNYFENLD